MLTFGDYTSIRKDAGSKLFTAGVVWECLAAPQSLPQVYATTPRSAKPPQSVRDTKEVGAGTASPFQPRYRCTSQALTHRPSTWPRDARKGCTSPQVGWTGNA